MSISHYPASSFRLCQVARVVFQPADRLVLYVNWHSLRLDLNITTFPWLVGRLNELLGILLRAEHRRELANRTPYDLFGAFGNQLQPFSRGLGVHLGTCRFLASLGLGNSEGHSKHCKCAHGVLLSSRRLSLAGMNGLIDLFLGYPERIRAKENGMSKKPSNKLIAEEAGISVALVDTYLAALELQPNGDWLAYFGNEIELSPEACNKLDSSKTLRISRDLANNWYDRGNGETA